jgi:extracellular elastinolytic metalloproteinase
VRFTLLARLGCLAALVVLVLPQFALADRGSSNNERDKKAFFDSRATAAAETVLNARERDQAANPSADVASLEDSLGQEGIVDIDPLTRTPRFVGKTDGFLTGPSRRAPADIALDFIRANAKVFGVDRNAVDSLQLTKDYVSIDGTHHLFFAQTAPDGVPVFANGIRANVASNGQLINFTGSPVASLGGAAGKPDITATAALMAAKQAVAQAIIPWRTIPGGDPTTRATTNAGGDSASLVYFQGVDGTRLAWKTETYGTDASAYQTVVDASTGKILYRHSLVNYGNGLAWDNYPGAPVGGTQRSVSLTGWLTPGATTLTGPNAHVYSDINDNNADDAATEDIPSTDAAGNFNYTFQPFGTPPFGNTINSPCTALFPCSWDSSFPSGAAAFPGQAPLRGSWRVNRRQNGVQVFFFVNTFHDHLAAAPIGFNEAAGNFQGDDALQAEPDDGAGTISNIFPDPNHTDNANMSTPPDGTSPRMQMFLFNDPVASDPLFGGAAGNDPFIQSNGGDEADVVYHEYTHGLSNRLVIDATGNSTLGGGQAGSMGEAWSDWYAMDFLVGQGQFVDTPTDGELRVGQYVGAGEDLIRTQPMDCSVGSTSPSCHGTPGAGPGGYTYGDFGKIIGQAEVHADGEIWGETLWDLRNALGQTTTEGLVTRAMELSPSNPSYLDMRNSILQADVVDNGGRNHDAIWAVFAHRGMGFFAAAVDGDDLAPAEDFSTPPGGKADGRLTGVVSDQDSGTPIQGIIVQFGGHNSGFTGTLAGLSDKKGKYEIRRIFAGTYPKVSASGPGYDPLVQTVTIGGKNAEHGNKGKGKDNDDEDNVRVNWALRRDWASLSGGGSISAFNGPDFSDFGCGPTGAIDQSETNGWGSSTDGDGPVFSPTGNVTPKFAVVQLPQAVNVSEISVNPSNTCGDGGSAATRGFKVEVSSDGITYTQVAKGVFYLGNRGHENTVFTGASANVRFVKFWMLNPQVPTAPTVGGVLPTCTGPADCGTDPDNNPGVALHCTPPNTDAFGGCIFMDMSEIKVFGSPAA